MLYALQSSEHMQLLHEPPVIAIALKHLFSHKLTTKQQASGQQVTALSPAYPSCPPLPLLSSPLPHSCTHPSTH
jgi:hypothetical protein